MIDDRLYGWPSSPAHIPHTKAKKVLTQGMQTHEIYREKAIGLTDRA